MGFLRNDTRPSLMTAPPLPSHTPSSPGSTTSSQPSVARHGPQPHHLPHVQTERLRVSRGIGVVHAGDGLRWRQDLGCIPCRERTTCGGRGDVREFGPHDKITLVKVHACGFGTADHFLCVAGSSHGDQAVFLRSQEGRAHVHDSEGSEISRCYCTRS